MYFENLTLFLKSVLRIDLSFIFFSRINKLFITIFLFRSILLFINKKNVKFESIVAL